MFIRAQEYSWTTKKLPLRLFEVYSKLTMQKKKKKDKYPCVTFVQITQGGLKQLHTLCTYVELRANL